MYTSFFGLNEKPFTITPDPRYLFMSERHGEGLAHLVYGVTESGGFIQLTGEVGTGKTTLVRTLLGQIPSEVDIALILNPQLTAVEFLTTICEELGLNLPNQRYSSKALVDALNRHLLGAHSQGRRTILLIDEAQNLSEGVLEQLRLLTNLETSRQKLLQIILIAQPELREKLAKANMRQLAQRVTGRYHLEPLSSEETSKYIDHRLRVAGALTEIFDAAAKKEVFRLSGGVPRVINVICDRALLGAYSKEVRTVNKRLVQKAASEVSGQKVRSGAVRWLAPALGIAALALAIALIWRPDQAGDPPVADSRDPAGLAERLPAEMFVTDEPSAAEDTLPAPVDPPVENVDIDALFTGYSGTVGFRQLFRLWGIDFDPTAGSACAQAEAAGLRCYFQRGSWGNLRQLDRPVLLTLTGPGGASEEFALTGLDDKTARLALAEGSVTVPVEQLTDYWFGQFLLLWRPPNNNDQPIGPGTRNENVRWLRQSLAEINTAYQPGSDSDVFDDELQQQLIAFQRQHRLDADGLAGQKTQIIINSMLASDDTPRLTANN
jgi:general secretion pathway protein A